MQPNLEVHLERLRRSVPPVSGEPAAHEVWQRIAAERHRRACRSIGVWTWLEPQAHLRFTITATAAALVFSVLMTLALARPVVDPRELSARALGFDVMRSPLLVIPDKR
jgi:hypothetical protein